MKTKSLRLAVAAILICCNAMLTSCSDSDNTPSHRDEEVAECTIIFYGIGGRNLDADEIDNLRQLYRGLRIHNNVEAVALFKTSSNPDADMLEKLSKQGFDFHPATAYRFCFDRTKANNPQLQFIPDNVYGGDGANINFSVADTLANYIKYAAAIRPARHYVLVLSDHGRGYAPNDDRPETLRPTSRGILYDDGFPYDDGNSRQCLSARALRTAIERSGVTIDALYLDACLMNSVEVLYELNNVTPYIIAATYYTPDVGGEYSSLVNRLVSSANYAQAVAGYCDDVADYWLRCEEAGINPGDYERSDINAISSEQLRQAAPALKTFIDQLTQDYSNPLLAKEIDAVTVETEANEKELQLFDLCAYFDGIAKVSSTALAEAARNAKAAIMKCKLKARGTKTTEAHGLPSFNFLIGANGAWEKLYLNEETGGLDRVDEFHWDGTKLTTEYGPDGNVTKREQSTWGSTGDETYAQLNFEKLTGWSRWIKQNKQKPRTTSLPDRIKKNYN